MKGPRALLAGVLTQHLILALAAASLAPLIMLSSDNAIQNSTMPFESFETVLENCTITASSILTKITSNHTQAPLPPFCDVHLSVTDLTLRVFDPDVQNPFARILDLDLFYQANKDAYEVHGRADVPIGRDLGYTAKSKVPGSEQKVVLAFFPGPKMTWKLWTAVISGLSWLTGEFEDAGLHFIVVQKHQGKVAEGHILNDGGPSFESQ